ncbi:hypothetical protein L226DRAFT_538217 [Lentinus tigrinus ALCF2SS1-7]|uniref:uncharacterized protein n=1 Tax=Lentinus tigrinus ALCF2SS1-7 TaxID=1328758 RepID=UPI001165DF9B|nr:hypothetical protein L226DRAFT_538217 [Lentinus tigrinus ALCF2SS1-7]
MTHGRHAFTGVETKKTVAAEGAEQFAARLKSIAGQATVALKMAKDTFQVQAKVGSSAYQLKLPRQWKAIHPVFNEALLSPAYRPEFPNQEPMEVTAPDVIDTVPEPEEILDSKVVRGGLQYQYYQTVTRFLPCA